MGELIREQVLLHTREEVPHSVAIAIDKVEEDEQITRILATVNVERKSQKGILIGKGGADDESHQHRRPRANAKASSRPGVLRNICACARALATVAHSSI